MRIDIVLMTNQSERLRLTQQCIAFNSKYLLFFSYWIWAKSFGGYNKCKQIILVFFWTPLWLKVVKLLGIYFSFVACICAGRVVIINMELSCHVVLVANALGKIKQCIPSLFLYRNKKYILHCIKCSPHTATGTTVISIRPRI